MSGDTGPAPASPTMGMHLQAYRTIEEMLADANTMAEAGAAL